jgi:hypothetical protein
VLPLTAHEFGHVFAARHDKMPAVVQECTAGGRVTDVEVRSWVADAFATGVMGPPYVWAMLLLRADPTNPIDRNRMAVMLKMLRKLGDGSAANYEQVVSELEGVWTSAGLQAGGEAGGADVDDLTTLVVDRVAARIAKPFGPTDWERALEIVEPLENVDGTIATIVDGLLLKDLRLVMAAAWHARTRLGKLAPEPDDEQMAWVDRQHDALAALAERTRLACVELIDRGTGGRAGARSGGARAVDQRPTEGGKETSEPKAVRS